MAIQRLPVEQWASKALQEKDPGKRVNTLLALTKAAGIDPFHRQHTDAPINQKMGKRILQSLLQIKWSKLSFYERLTLVRTPSCDGSWQTIEQVAKKVVAQLDSQFPAESFEMNWLLWKLLPFSSPRSTKEYPSLSAATQEQMEWRSLRNLKSGWTHELRSILQLV